MRVVRTIAVATMTSIALFAGQAIAGTDPIRPDPNTGANFNRYNYANNNPYKYVDPDGRAARIVHHEGGIRIEMPTRFTGVGATATHIDHVRSGFEGQSGVYNVNGAPTQVDFRITPITSDTPAALQNVVKMFEGPTDHPKGTNYADAVGGTQASLDVQSLGFQHGAGPHELNHLAGAIDGYSVDKNGIKMPDRARPGDIMNQLPGRMTDIGVREMLENESNVRVGSP